MFKSDWIPLGQQNVLCCSFGALHWAPHTFYYCPVFCLLSAGLFQSSLVQWNLKYSYKRENMNMKCLPLQASVCCLLRVVSSYHKFESVRSVWPVLNLFGVNDLNGIKQCLCKQVFPFAPDLCCNLQNIDLSFKERFLFSFSKGVLRYLFLFLIYFDNCY